MSVSTNWVSAANGPEAVLMDLFEEIACKLQAGEPIDLEAYTRAYPEQAEQLRRLLPAIDVLADLGRSAAKGDAAVGFQPALAESDRGVVGEFRILKEIGRGGMGVVYEAEQVSLGRRVALKVLPFAAALDPKQLQRFKNEAQAAAHLQHQHIVPVYAVGCERGVHFYAMQYIDGQSLAAVIRELRQLAGPDTAQGTRRAGPASELADDLLSGRLAPVERSSGEAVRPCPAEGTTGSYPPPSPSPQPLTSSPCLARTPRVAGLSTEHSIKSPAFFRTVAHLGVQAAEALEYAHQAGVIHRDIKPANLLLDDSGRLWVTDFGLAKLGGEAGPTMTGDLVGTLRYMSPEQALAEHALIDARTDVYSLGATLYELLTVEPAFPGRDRQEVLRQIAFEEPRPPRQVNKAVPPELETIVLKAMAKIPVERYATAQELADDLRRYLEDKPIQARRPTLAQRTRKWARRHRPLVWAMGILAAVVVTVVIVALAVSNVLISGKQRELERSLYFNRIHLAEREWAENNMTRADQALAECPNELRGWEWYYLQRLRRGDATRLPLHGAVLCVRFSPDGGMLAAGSMSGMVRIWNTKSWHEIRTLPQQKGGMFTLAFSPQGHRLATASLENNGVDIWDLESGRVLFSLPRETPNSLGQVVFSRDGRLLASAGGKDWWIRVWDANSGSLLYTLPETGTANKQVVQCLALHPDGQRLASGSWDYTVKVWDLKTRRQVWSFKSPVDEFYRVEYSPDGQLLAAAGGHHFNGRPANILLFDAATGKQVQELKGHTKSVLGLAFSPDGRLASGSEDLTVKLWDVASGKEAITLYGHRDSIWDVAFSPDGHRLASAGADGWVRIWDGTPLEDSAGQELLTIPAHNNSEVYCLAFSPDGKRLASGGEDRTARIWDAATGKELQTLRGFEERVEAIAFSRDGRWLAIGSHFSTGPGFVLLCDARSWQKREPFLGVGEKSVAFSPDGRWVAGGDGADFRIRVWDVLTGRQTMILPGHDFMVPSLAFSPDGRRLASGSFDTTVKIWDVGPEQQFRPLFAFISPTPFVTALSSMLATQVPSVRTLSGFESRINGVAFSRDGRLAAGGMDRVVRVWDATTWKEILAFRDPTGGICSLAFSPDGRRIATGGTDATVKLWDAATGQLQRTLYGHGHWVSAVVFSPDGERLASSSYDGTVKLWAADP